MQKFAILTQKNNPKTNHKEWVLVSRKDRRPLKYFGPEKPSKEEVSKEERRIQYFKSRSSAIETLIKRSVDLNAQAIQKLLWKISQVGIEDSSHSQGRIDYNLTGNDFWAGGAGAEGIYTRLKALYKKYKQKSTK